MNIDLSAKDFKLTPANRLYVETKFIKLERFNQKINRIRVELDVDRGSVKGLIYRVEVWIFIPGRVISAGEKAEHMNEAIDLVYPKLEKQLTKAKDKAISKKRPARRQ